jgi:hypothetical protein
MNRTSQLFSLAIIFVLLVNLPNVSVTSAASPSGLENVPLSIPAGLRNGFIYGGWGSSPDDVYAVGVTYVNAPLLYHKDGLGWNNASPASMNGWRYVNFYNAWGSSASDVYLVGTGIDMAWNSLPLFYHYDGMEWTTSDLSLPAGWNYGELYSAWGTSASDVYAAGGAYGSGGRTPLIYHYDGSSWTRSTPSLPALWDEGELYGVWGSSSENIYAVGYGLGLPLVYHNDGSGWIEASPSLPDELSVQDLYGIWGTSASNIYMVGAVLSKVTRKTVPLLYHYDGTDWNIVTVSLPAGWGDSNMRGIWGSSANDIYAVGQAFDSNGQSLILVYHYDGTGWLATGLSLPPGWSDGYLRNIWGTGASDIYAAGFVEDGGGRSVPLIYHNDGTSWTQVALPATIYVDRNATGANNGISWANAYTDLQSALALASSGDEIWVADGTYKPTAGIDRTISFALKNGVAIYGGFAGSEISRDQRDPAAHVTVLSGDIGTVGNASDNSYHVLIGSNTDNTTVLDGFTITDGNANGTDMATVGGGMYNYMSSPRLTNVTFMENSATQSGGGMFNENHSSPTLTHVTFKGNTATSFGGGMDNFLSTPTLTDVTFLDNLAGNGGGMNNTYSEPTLANVSFHKNGLTDVYGKGGGMNNFYSDPILTNVTFSENSPTFSGGGMYNDGSNPILTDVTFYKNAATHSGGGMTSRGSSSPILTNVTFQNNSASSGGGMRNDYYNHPILTNVTFSANTATNFGGGMSNENYSNPTLTNVTFSGNTATIVGGGLYNDLSGSNATIRNSILYGNSGGEIYDGRDPAVVSYSIVQGGYLGTSNLNADPLLGPLQDNGGFTRTMSLDAGSPAIDAGADANCSTTDQRGVARPQGSHCDIGAYEYDGPLVPTPTETDTPTSTATPSPMPTATSTRLATPTATPAINYDRDTTGVFRPSNGLLYLKNSNDTGFADAALNYGLPGDYPVVGDWDGNGTVTIGIYRNGYFYLKNANTLGFADVVFPFGQAGDQPIAGDWNGDGADTIGIFRPSTGQFQLRNDNSEGPADKSFYLGNVGDVGIAGDWDKDGIDTTGVFRPSNGIIFLKNKNEDGFADIALNYGLPGDRPVTGDWDNDGIDTIGVYRSGQFMLRNSNTLGFAEIIFGLGNPGDMPIAGDWDGLP